MFTLYRLFCGTRGCCGRTPQQAEANASLVAGGLHGQTALHLSYLGGTGLAGLGNRGFKNEGLSLEVGKIYDGYLFAKSNKPVTITVAVVSYIPNSTETYVPPIVYFRNILPEWVNAELNH